MSIVSAFIVPGSPLPYVKRDNPPWSKIADGLEAAGEALRKSKPDVILVYSTQWLAALDELWQTRRVVEGLHVDENWHEFGDLPYKLKVDTKLAKACIKSANDMGVKSKGVDYDAFPIDTGTIVMNNFMNPGGAIPLVIAANNLYHDYDLTWKLGQMAAAEARKQKKRVAVVGIGNMSGTFFRDEIDIGKDHIVDPKYDRANKKILRLIEKGDAEGLVKAIPSYAKNAKADMGFKHAGWVLGALNNKFKRGKVHAYGPVYGTGAAVIEIHQR